MMENATAEFTGLTPQETHRIVKDLVEKYPRGPHGRLTKECYEPAQVWSEAYHKMVPEVRLRPNLAARTDLRLTDDNLQSWGYDPVLLYALGIRSEDEAKRLLQMLEPGTPDGPSLTRRGRRLWSRTKWSLAHIQSQGAAGIWHVMTRSAPYGSHWYRGISVWARGRTEAEAQALLIGPSTGLQSNWTLSVEFMCLGTPEQATSSSIATVNLEVDRLRNQIADRERDLEQLRLRLAHQLEIAGGAMGGIMLLSTPMDDSEVGQSEEVQS